MRWVVIAVLAAWTLGCSTLTRREWTAIQDECRESVRQTAGPLNDIPFEYDLCVKKKVAEEEKLQEGAAGRP